MFCPNCRNQVVDGAEFCPNCCANIKEIQSQIYNQSQNNYQQPMNNQNNSSNKKSLLLSIIIVIILVIVGMFGVSKLMKKDTSVNNNDTNNNLTYDKSGAFLMSIEDVFTITGRGTVVTGRVERGTIKLNDEVQIIGLNHEIITTTVTGIEMFRKSLDYAETGDNAGLLLKDVSREDVERGQVVAKPNSISSATKFDADVYVLTKEEGGRNTPFFNDYKPQFHFRTADVTGVINLPSNIKAVKPGNNSKMTVELISNIAMEVGTEFSISEGGKTVGKGTVTKVY